MKHALGFGLMSLLFVAACGSDKDPSSNTEIVRAFAGSAIGTVKGSAPAPARMTRARLAEVITPVMLVTINNTGHEALIAEIQTNGGVSTWSSVDDITISLRNGVIVATRGFGADLMAAAVPAVSRSNGGGTAHVRVHTLLNGEDQPVRTQFACIMQNVGQKVIDIVEISYQSTHVIETCAADGERFQNEYWISNDQKMRKSKQWISADVGFLTIEDVRR
ncbi:MAG: YjbF family lipoprotein [Paracoccaceae bacterium]